jgi:D-proline reductase (dithiol) PrdB
MIRFLTSRLGGVKMADSGVTQHDPTESLAAFLESFAYGSRNDLLFKFLHPRNGLKEQGGAEFFRRLLELLGEAFDTGDYSEVVEHCVSAQLEGYTPSSNTVPLWAYDDTPWAPLAKPLSESRLALISAGGLFVEHDDPLPDQPTQEQAIPRIDEFLRMEPTLSEIPLNVDRSTLRVRHPGYDIRGTERDHNVVFPIDRLLEAQQNGTVGEIAETNYSFVGATSQLRLKKHAAPAWAGMLIERGVDAALLVGA